MNYVNQFKESLHKVGLTCNENIIVNGEVNRFYVDGDKIGSKNGWYVIFDDTIPAGAFGCWKRNINQKWCSRLYDSLNQQDQYAVQRRIREAQQKREEEQKKLRREAQLKAQDIWNKSQSVQDNHPYLLEKAVKAYGIREHKGKLVIPIFDNKQILHSLQFITATGEKRFLCGGAINGHYHLIGRISSTIYICEGYATAATIYEVTQHGVIVAFNSNNLSNVAKVIREVHSEKNIILCADNDQWTDGNPGLSSAKEAAIAINAKAVFPIFKEADNNKQPTDFNDLMQIYGIDVVKEQLEAYKDSNSFSVETDAETIQNPGKITQSTLLLELLKDVELFHDERKQSYATFNNNGIHQTWMVESGNFKEWLNYLFWSKHKKALSRNTLQDCIATIHGKALYEGKRHKVFTRVGILGKAIYIHLANENWEAVEVTKEGWKIVTCPPLKFKGSRNMEALPRPEQGGSIDLLWDHVNIPEKARKLTVAWILDCWRYNTHFPILLLTGLQGSAKSTTQDFLRDLIDPNSGNLRNAPKKSEDIFIAAANNWLVSFNNMSNLTAQNQDDLCCLSTGGSVGTRQLYTTADEEVIDIKRPVILNGINDLITAQDLIDRTLSMELPPIDKCQRKSDTMLRQAFKEAQPFILGGLLDAFVKALNVLPAIKLLESPRMADYAYLGVALEKALGWHEGSFLREYEENRNENIAMALEYSPVAVALLQYMENSRIYSGSYGNLYKTLTGQYRPEMSGWPKSPKGLANMIKRQMAGLKLLGMCITFDPVRKRDGCHIEITYNLDLIDSRNPSAQNSPYKEIY